jgi:hypothetical protein
MILSILRHTNYNAIKIKKYKIKKIKIKKYYRLKSIKKHLKNNVKKKLAFLLTNIFGPYNDYWKKIYNNT